MEVAFAFYEPISSCRLLEAVNDDLVLKVNMRDMYEWDVWETFSIF